MSLESAIFLMRLLCIQCGWDAGQAAKSFCDYCGGMMDVSYDLSGAVLHSSSNPYKRFRDILPVCHGDHYPSDAAYTPVVHAQSLGALIGLDHLYLKDETKNPTGSTKDRMAAVSLPYLNERGVTAFCTSSTGNSSTAYARAIARFPHMRMFLFTAERFQHRVQHTDSPNIVHFVLRGATFTEAFEYAGQFAGLNGLHSERGFFNPGRREGLKTAWLEANEQIPQPIDWYVQAVSSAMGVYGTWMAAKQLETLRPGLRPPHLLCVQQQSCSPMVHAWREGSPTIEPHHRVPQPDGIADAILRGDPTRAYPHVRRIVKESDGDMVSVSESEIRSARQLVEDNEGITPCFSASAAVAGLIRQRQEGRIKAEETILINLTGRDRPAMVSQQAGSDSLKLAVMLERDGSSYRPMGAIDAEIANLCFH